MTDASRTPTEMAPTRPYRICTRCIMDTSDPDIVFDDAGVCNHCHTQDELIRRYVRSGDEAQRALDAFVATARAEGRGKSYDCIIGVSGGVDSTYVAYVTRELGLRPLAVHMDNGWDSELAVKNIENVLQGLGIDLYTHVLDWDEFRSLQVSFLRASVPDAEIPTDHAIGGLLYRIASRYGIRQIISGSNIATEGMLPRSWVYGVADWKYIRGVHAAFGGRPLRHYPHYSLADLTYYATVRRIRSFRVLDYVPYVKTDVMRVLQEQLGWKYYGGKHYESLYTRFFQGYILPRKFGIDKRRSHLATLVSSGQMTRDAALAEIAVDPYSEAMQRDDREYVIKKLELTDHEFRAIMNAPIRSFRDYPNSLATRERVVRALDRAGILPLARRVIRAW